YIGLSLNHHSNATASGSTLLNCSQPFLILDSSSAFCDECEVSGTITSNIFNGSKFNFTDSTYTSTVQAFSVSDSEYIGKKTVIDTPDISMSFSGARGVLTASGLHSVSVA